MSYSSDLTSLLASINTNGCDLARFTAGTSHFYICTYVAIMQATLCFVQEKIQEYKLHNQLNHYKGRAAGPAPLIVPMCSSVNTDEQVCMGADLPGMYTYLLKFHD